jgi:uncharacterized delta-60 repeat protein
MLDPDFDGDGRVTLAGGGFARAVLVQPDRKIIVAGNASGSPMMTVTRLQPNGSLDTTFDGDGTATIDFGSFADLAGGAALQPDGKIVLAGSTQATGDFAVARLKRQWISGHHVRRRREGDRRLRRRRVRLRGRAPAERADRRRRPEDGGRRLRGGAPAGLTQARPRRGGRRAYSSVGAGWRARNEPAWARARGLRRASIMLAAVAIVRTPTITASDAPVEISGTSSFWRCR